MASSTTMPDDADATIFSPKSSGRAPAQPMPGNGSAQPLPQGAASDAAPPFGRLPSASDTTLWPPRPPRAEAPRGMDVTMRAPSTLSDHSSALPAVFDVYGDNIGLALAAPIFDLLFRVQNEAQVDVPALHQELINALKTYETQASHKGLTPVHVRVLLYGLAATADDIILKTSWGSDSAWSQKSMISTFFRETWGGERFFSLLSRMMSAPHSFAREIELYYFCLQFGFQGRYRLEPQGAGELSRIREELYLFLRGLRGETQAELSPAWRGLKVESGRFRDAMPYWLAGLGLLLAMAAVFVVLSTLLNRNAEQTVADVNNLVGSPTSLLRQAQPLAPASAPAKPVTQPAAPPAKPAPPPQPTIAQQLAPQETAGLLKVLDRNGKTVIVTTRELFASGSTTLRAPYPDTLNAVAQALQTHPGKIQVIGYTDDVPIRTPTYPDNIALSKARAKVVADLISGKLSDPNRVTSTGLGAADPVEPNTTNEGRQANRRVEITLTPP